MPERLHPGVYVEEVKPAVRAIEGVSTSTASFLGAAERGPKNQATLVTSFAEYQRIFGGFRSDSFLSYSVQNFFANGGKKCYIVRIVGANSATADITLKDRERVGMQGTLEQQILADVLPSAVAERVLTIKASSPGLWGNQLDVEIMDGSRDPLNEFKMVVKLQDQVVETWDNLSMSLGDENYVESLLGSDRSQYIQVQRIATATSDTPGVLISGKLDGPAQNLAALADPQQPVITVALPVDEPLGANNTAEKIQLTKTGTDDAPKIAAEIQAKVNAAAPAGASAEVRRAFQNFQCVFVPSSGVIGARYVLISGSDAGSLANPSKIIIRPILSSSLGTNQVDICTRLKLDTNATADDDRPVSVDGQLLQHGTSISANEPETTTNGNRMLSFNLNCDGFQSVQLDSGQSSGDAVADNIKAKVRALAPQRKDAANESAYANFDASYDARYELTFDAPSGYAGDFKFVAVSSSTPATKDLSASLRLRNLTPGSANPTFGGKPTDFLTIKPGLTNRERTIISGSAKDARPSTNLHAGDQLHLQVVASVDPPSGSPPGTPATRIPVPLDITFAGVEISGGEAIAAAIQAAVRTNTATLTSPAGLPANTFTAIQAALTGFTARYVAYYTLTSGDVRTTDAAGNDAGPISSVVVLPAVNPSEDIAPSLKIGLVNGGTEQNGAAMLRPVNGEYHLGDNTKGGAVVSVTRGDDGSDPANGDYVGDGVSTGLNALDKIKDVSLIAIPGIGSKQVTAAGFGYCANRPLLDCFFIADLGGAPQTDTAMFRSDVLPVTTPTDARAFVNALPTKNDYGAIYFPWIKAPDPIGMGKNPTRILPPSGYVAGMYARIDNQRGVFKAPAGTETNLTNVLDLAAQIDDGQQDLLNPLGINVIRSFPAAGTVIWGARTLSSDSAYRYISVRRMAIFLRVSIYNGIQYAVFEPNDDDLWASLRLTVGAFMLTQFRAGAFQGTGPSKAFFVKCDATTTTQADIDNGVVNILVGFAPLKPAEFVVLRLQQIAGQSS